MKQVFISYSTKNETQAKEIVDALERQGIECWIAPRDIPVGFNYIQDIPGAIESCPCFLLVLSRQSMESKWVRKELTTAVNLDKRLLPLMIEDLTDFNFLLVDVQTRPYFLAKEQTLREITKEIRAMSPQVHPAPRSADPSVAERYFRMGDQAYRNGLHETAVKWYRRAAELGHARAQNDLGWCYKNGHGVKRDPKEAFALYQQAAVQGYALAQYNLGWCCENGYGTGKDLVEAKKWYQKAAEQGDRDARKALKTLK